MARALNIFYFLSFLVNMENLPNLLYSLAVDGNARKEKGGRKKKKRQSEKMAMKQRKSCGNLQTKIPAKTMQKITLGGNQAK